MRAFRQGRQALLCIQPTLSVQIGIVEENLGIQLFERTSGTVLITPVGERFLHRARVTLAAMNDLMDAVTPDSAALGGVVRLGMPPTFGPYFPADLPAAPAQDISRPQNLYRRGSPAAIETAVAEGTLDCDLGPSCGEPSLTFFPIGSERLYLGVPADHRLAQRRSVTVKVLKSERLLALGSGNRLLENV